VRRTLPDDWFPRELPAGLQIGPRSWLHSAYHFLHCAPDAANVIRIGSDTGLYRGTFLELGPTAHVEIGNFCSIVGAIIRAEREVTIGDYAFIAHEVVITDCEDPGRARWSSAPLGRPPPGCEPRPVHIGNDVWIGMRAVILAGVTIGDGAIVAAGAMVSEDVPALTIAAGNPARIRRRVAR
jgi:acetyltransferase-like isoleucine patch superfamily enzyme